MPGEEPGQQPSKRDSPPEDTFALVGHEIRAELIQVLGRDELSLSELRARLAADVEPSQLHYHLKQLVGHFVEKTDDAYRLNSVGHRLKWTLRAGALGRREEHLTVAADVDCYYCGESVEATYDSGNARMACPGCKHVYMTDYYAVALDAFEDEMAAFSHFSQYMIRRILSLGRGVCPSCGDALATSFVSLPAARDRDVEIGLSCESCGAGWWLSVGMALLADTGLVAFCYDHGVDVLSTPHWELEFAATDEHVTVRSTDPWAVALAVTLDEETLELVVDGDLNVVERNRNDSTHIGGSSFLSGIRDGTATVDNDGSEAIAILPNNDDCFVYLRHHRWADGVTCPHCDRQDTVKRGTTGKGAKRYQCRNCDSTFNDLTGTVFADHRLTLAEMFHIIREMDETNPDGIARQIDRSAESVSDFVRDVRDVGSVDSEFRLQDTTEG